MKVQKPPLDPESVRQMHQLWLSAFGNDFVSDAPDDVLYGEENRWNRTNIYRHISEEQATSKALVIRPSSLPSLGGLHSPRFRGKGLATRICQQLGGRFLKYKGLVLFLGTVNPDAARIYERLGW